MFFRRKTIYKSYVLVMDALGFANRIRRADVDALSEVWKEIDHQYNRFQARVPNTVVIDGGALGVFATREMETLRVNDMFIVYTRKKIFDPALRYLVTSSMLYHQMLLEGFIPRGGLGFGLIARGDGLLIGNGFIDAYERAEKRPPEVKDICAVEISPQAMATLRPTRRVYQLLCFYRDRFFIHPYSLTDPDMGEFNGPRIMDFLRKSGANEAKLSATEEFLGGFEDWKQMEASDSQTRRFAEKLARIQQTEQRRPTVPDGSE
jgi:hypothetical protein